jgi:transcriptional regulator GlxA family with amidase domain
VSTEEFLTIQQIAARWKLSPDKVRRVFAQEAGVLIFGNETSRGNRRKYSTMRIPRDVLLRVERKYSYVGHEKSKLLKK